MMGVALATYEQDGLDRDREIAMFQELIDSGVAWHLQGSYGRRAMALIESGDCILGEEAHVDAYGNRVPSRTEVKPGTKGSIEYQQQMRLEREED